jgi:hypothetical protein
VINPAEIKRYRVDMIKGKQYYVPNKKEAIEIEDKKLSVKLIVNV